MQESQAVPHPTNRTADPAQSGLPQPCQNLAVVLRDYARQRPEVAALWCLGIGFVLGWKLKPW